MMTRAQAIGELLRLLSDELVVAANGLISRETFASRDRGENFYMLGSMGLASSIGLGLALTRPKRRVVVFDGDGNLLMRLGNVAMVAERRPPNLLHVVFDNEAYGSTGGQRSISDRVPLVRLAEAAGYRQWRKVDRSEDLTATGRELLASEGPSFLLVKVSSEAASPVGRVALTPPTIARRFRAAALGADEDTISDQETGLDR